MDKILGLPPLASEAGGRVDLLIVLIHWLMIILFIGWLIYFFLSIYKFRKSRNAQADYVGVRSHASSYLEVLVAGVEVLLLVGFALPVWVNHAAKFPKESESTVIQIVAQQFGWNARYAGRDGEFGRQDMALVKSDNVFGVDPADAKGKDDVQILNEIHVPVNKPVICYVSSKDVIHSFRVIAMRVAQDAIPGMRIPIHFKPVKEGRYQINCAQLCGNGHASMSAGYLIVESQAAYDKWLASKIGANTSFE
ncbi:MAG: cytochrome c oxidase subunit II [Verrucomicrobiota bacterium]